MGQGQCSEEKDNAVLAAQVHTGLTLYWFVRDVIRTTQMET